MLKLTYYKFMKNCYGNEDEVSCVCICNAVTLEIMY